MVSRLYVCLVGPGKEPNKTHVVAFGCVVQSRLKIACSINRRFPTTMKI